MIINRTYSYIYIHPPKCAGTSIGHALIDTCQGLFDIELGCTWTGRKINPFFHKAKGVHKHSTASEIAERLGDDRQGVPAFQSFYAFSSVRDPAERTISAFKYLKRWRDWDGSDVMKRFADPNQMVASDFWQYWGPGRIFRPQAHWIDRPLDYLIRVDRIQDDFDMVCAQIGVDSRRLEVKNASAFDRQYELTPDTLERIRNRYAKDYKLIENSNQPMELMA